MNPDWYPLQDDDLTDDPQGGARTKPPAPPKSRQKKRIRRRRMAAVIAVTAAALLFPAAAAYSLRAFFRSNPGGKAGFSTSPGTSVPTSVDMTGSVSHATDGTGQSPPETDWQAAGWQRVAVTADDLSQGTLILARAGTPFDASAAETLVQLSDTKNSDYFVRSTGLYVSKQIVDPLNRMLSDFAAESGLRTINIVAGWRSADYQRRLWDKAVREKGQDHAEKYIAHPGESEHHTGLAVDLALYFESTGLSDDFTGEGPYVWIKDNAWRYGFIQRYPEEKAAVTGISGETWHYRYVGLPHAMLIAEHNFCLEEYLDWLKQYPFEGQHLTVDCLGKRYEICRCTGEVFEPAEGETVLSGDNVDGFLVTVCLGDAE